MTEFDIPLIDAIESIPASFMVFDSRLRLRLWNHVTIRMYPELSRLMLRGVTLASLIDAYRSLCVDPDAAGLTLMRMADASDELEEQFALKDGRWMDVRGRRTIEGGVVWITSDISGRMRTQSRLEEAEARLYSLVSAASLSLFSLDRDGRFILSVGSAAGAPGRGADVAEAGAITGQSVFELHRGDPEFLDAIRSALGGESLIRVVSIGGDTFEVTFTPSRSADGAVSGLIGIAINSGEKMQAERVLKESDARFRAITEVVPMPVIISRLSDGQLLYGNRQLARTFGVPVSDLISQRTPNFYVNPNDRLTLIELVQQTGFLRDYEVQVRRADGTPFWVSLTCQIMEVGGEDAILVIFHDVTRQKDAEQALYRAKEAAERAVIAKNKFFAAASHDLRQPLQALRLFATILERRTNDPELMPLVEGIAASSRAMEELLGTLLDLSKLQAGAVTPNMYAVPLAAIFSQLRVELEPQAREKGLDLRIVGTGANVYSDSILLTRILRNLVSNAIRYTETGRVLVGCRRSGGRLTIEVHDTGPGIPSEDLGTIFEEFYQRDGDAGKGGLGLGLSIVNRAAQLLGLVVAVRSTVGRGTVFSLAFPVMDGGVLGAEVTEDEVRATLRDLTGLRIALVDDNTAVLSGLRMVLEQAGCEVVSASDPQTLYNRIDGLGMQVDVLIVDLRLGHGETGLDVIEAVRRSECNVVPAIIITAEPGAFQSGEPLPPRCVLLQKPVNGSVLAQTIERMADQTGANPEDPAAT